MEKQQVKLHPNNPRLTHDGFEHLDPKPKMVYAKIDPVTGEILSDGMPRPRSLTETIAAATARGGMLTAGWDEGDDDDTDFDAPLNDGSLPPLSPHQEGFVENMGMDVGTAIKTLKKRGYTLFKPSKKDADPSSTASPPLS